MPELPEIITIRNDLAREVVGKKVVGITTHADYPLNPSKEHFEKHVIGHKIENVSNIAKLIIFKISSGKYISVHLKMTGNLLFDTDDKYKKISLNFNDGSVLHYSTVRKFSFFEVWDETKKDNYANRFGKTALESNLGAQEFAELIKSRKVGIKTALLDQRLVSGIGNIYANDALYLAKIHPNHKTRKLKNQQLKTLFEKVIFVMEQGVKNRGSSIDRFKDIYGQSGDHQNHFWVYGKRGNKCAQCNMDIIQFEKIQGRGTYYCLTCQISP